MHKKLLFLALLSVLWWSAGQASRAQENEKTFSQVTGKKLLEYTWGPPRPEFVMENIREMEKWPFEGTIMRPFFGSGQVFNSEVFAKHTQLISSQFDKYKPIESSKLTDNFMAMYAASTMDWFSDDDWKLVSEHTRLVAKGARLTNCAGIMFDPEPYGFNPWIYKNQKHAKEKSLEEYIAKVRQRGREFMNAIQSEFPNAKILFFFYYQQAYHASSHPDQKVREATLANLPRNDYLLLMPFVNGMLEAAMDGIRLIDGNEHAYSNSSAEDFYRQYWVMHKGAQIYVPAELKQKFIEHNRAANSLYIDGLMGVGLGDMPTWAREMTEEERWKWFEHNLHYALKTTDEYVWFYGEKITWWTEGNAELNPKRGQMTEVINKVKKQLMNDEKLGYTMKETVQEARQKAEGRKASLAAKIKPKTATAAKLQTPLTIDGQLGEAAYQELPWLDEFVNFADTPGKPTASTRAWVGYDDENLYLAFQSNEPQMASLVVHDNDIWMGETIDFSILLPGELPRSHNSKYFHLILNPNNKRYNRIQQGTLDTDDEFKVNWKSAVAKNATGWTAEIALPWKEMGFGPMAAGKKVHLNLARHRKASANEFTSWSQYAHRFQEPENFGVIELKAAGDR